MSRPQKIHKPLRASFSNILAAVARGQGKGKAAATRLARQKAAGKPLQPEKK